MGEHRRCIPKAGGSNPPISTWIRVCPGIRGNSKRGRARARTLLNYLPTPQPSFPRSSTDEHRITDPWMQVRLLSGELSYPMGWVEKRWQAVLWSLSGGLPPRNMGVMYQVVRSRCKRDALAAWRVRVSSLPRLLLAGTVFSLPLCSTCFADIATATLFVIHSPAAMLGHWVSSECFLEMATRTQDLAFDKLPFANQPAARPELRHSHRLGRGINMVYL